jgi:hypothetical protein
VATGVRGEKGCCRWADERPRGGGRRNGEPVPIEVEVNGVSRSILVESRGGGTRGQFEWQDGEMEKERSEVGPIRRMQMELASPIVGRPDHKEADDAFVEALEPQMELLTKFRGKGEGELNVVMPHLLARALSDLMAAMHLGRRRASRESLS